MEAHDLDMCFFFSFVIPFFFIAYLGYAQERDTVVSHTCRVCCMP